MLVQCDLLDSAAVTEMGRAAATAFGGLDILVNNASSFYPTPLGDIDEDDWNDLIGTNLKAPLFLAQAAAAALRERGGLIVNLADIHGIAPHAPPSGVLRRESRPHHADEVAGAGARAAGASQRDRAGACHVAGRWRR